MKKILNILLIVMISIGISACKSQNETIKKEEKEEPMIEIEDIKKEEENLGGWNVYQEEPVFQTTQEGMEVMELALKDIKEDVSYRPFIELGTQIASGKNYMYLAYENDKSKSPSTNLVVITAYKDLQGNVSLLHINPFNILGMMNAKQNEDAVGAWKENENLVKADLPESAQNAFDGATKDLLGANYEPIALLATQVIAGERLAILAKQTMVTANPTTNLVIMFIYSGFDKTNSIENIYTLNLADFNK